MVDGSEEDGLWESRFGVGWLASWLYLDGSGRNRAVRGVGGASDEPRPKRPDLVHQQGHLFDSITNVANDNEAKYCIL